MAKTNIRRPKEDSASYEPQDPSNNVVVNSLGFLLTSFIPDVELKMLATQKHQQVQTSKTKQTTTKNSNKRLCFLAKIPGKK